MRWSMRLALALLALLSGCATPPGRGAEWFLTMRTVTGPHPSEAACAAALRTVRATIEAMPKQAGNRWTFVCDTQAR